MGKEWLWCAAGGARKERAATPGCLTAVFQLFDLHREVPSSHFATTATGFQPLDQKPQVLKGIEAPRNSLEMDEPDFLKAPSLSSATKMQDIHIPCSKFIFKNGLKSGAWNSHPSTSLGVKVGIHIKTRVETVRSSTSEYTSSPDYLSSPGAAKTPTLVARLMGLDLLPDTSSPSPCSSNRSTKNPKPKSKSHLKNPSGTRSLPETPRISSARKSDVDQRLSLHSSRDSVERAREIALSNPRIRFVKRDIREDGEVRDKVREIKEGASRRFGVEITNRVENRGFGNKGMESEIVLLKAKTPSHNGEELYQNKYSLKLLEKEKQNRLILKRELEQKEILKRNNVIKTKQTEPFVRSNLGRTKSADLVSEKRKCFKKMALTNSIVKNNGIQILPVKKEPFFPPTKLPPKQKQSQVSNSLSSKSITQLSSSSSHKYKQPPPDKSTVQYRSNGTGSTTFAGPQFLQYIKEVLILSNIDTNTSTFSTKLRLDPTIFSYLELSHSHFTLRCNRKLVYELVSELSEEVFRPITKFKTWGLRKLNDYNFCGSELSEKLCKKIRSFPEANCQVLEDIDALIDGDLAEIELRRLMGFEEESVAIVEEIGVELLDNIVNEMTMEML